MIYCLEKRYEFECGQKFAHYEVVSYTHITKIGIYAGGVTLKKGSLKQCENFIRRKGINIVDHN